MTGHEEMTVMGTHMAVYQLEMVNGFHTIQSSNTTVTLQRGHVGLTATSVAAINTPETRSENPLLGLQLPCKITSPRTERTTTRRIEHKCPQHTHMFRSKFGKGAGAPSPDQATLQKVNNGR